MPRYHETKGGGRQIQDCRQQFVRDLGVWQEHSPEQQQDHSLGQKVGLMQWPRQSDFIQARMYRGLSQANIKDIKHILGAHSTRIWVVKLHVSFQWFCLFIVCWETTQWKPTRVTQGSLWWLQSKMATVRSSWIPASSPMNLIPSTSYVLRIFAECLDDPEAFGLCYNGWWKS